MMSNFKNKLSAFMYGRYGADDLYNALTITELVLLVIGAVFSFLGHVASGFGIVSMILYAIAVGLLIWSMFRFFSRKCTARRRENAAWLRFTSKLTAPFRRPKCPPDTDTHIFRACPACAAVLRLPRTPGKHTVKCPRCGKGFSVRVKG